MKNLNNWNTNDVRALNAVMKVPEMAEVRVAIFDSYNKKLVEEMLWNEVLRFGIHHPEGKYFDIDLKYNNFVFNMEFALDGDGFIYKVTPKSMNKDIYFFVQALIRHNNSGMVEKKDDSLVIVINDKKYEITFIGEKDNSVYVNTSNSGIVFRTKSTLYIACNKEGTAEKYDEIISKRRYEAQNEIVRGGGILSECPEAIIKGVAWNTIYEPIKGRFCTPVSRAWCKNNGEGFGSYVIFDWDTFFAGILSSIENKELAYQQIYSILQEITENGFVPNFGCERCKSEDRSQPPVGAYCVLKLYTQFREKEFLENTYKKLKTWNRWWMKNRDGNNDGLLEWGSDKRPDIDALGFETGTMQAAMFESGLDNSPMYDDAEFDQSSHTMNIVDVGLNSLYALDLWALSKIAGELGNYDDKEKFTEEYNHMKELINEVLWNEKLGIYCNKYWNGKFSNVLTPTNFYPLIAGVASKDKALTMVKEHLLNENEFWGEYVIPSISKNHPSFKDNNYWRGRIWGPMNFLLSEGLKRYDLFDESFMFSRKSLNLFLKEWKEENHIHENYNAVTGDGDDVKNADPVYTWGALTAYIAIGEYIEVRPFDGIRFGNLSGEEGKVNNYLICSDRYTVECSKTLNISQNGINFIYCNVPAIVKIINEVENTLFLEVISREQGTMSINTNIIKPQIKILNIKLNQKAYETINMDKDVIDISL